MAVRYERDDEGIGQILVSDEMEACMAQVAADVMERTEAGAPVGKPPHDTHPGMFREGFGLDSKGEGGPKGNRAEGDALNDAEDEALVDVVDKYHVLERAITSMGDL